MHAPRANLVGAIDHQTIAKYFWYVMVMPDWTLDTIIAHCRPRQCKATTTVHDLIPSFITFGTNEASVIEYSTVENSTTIYRHFHCKGDWCIACWLYEYWLVEFTEKGGRDRGNMIEVGLSIEENLFLGRFLGIGICSLAATKYLKLVRRWCISVTFENDESLNWSSDRWDPKIVIGTTRTTTRETWFREDQG